MNPQVKQILNQLGLSDREIEVYFAYTKYGESVASAISRKLKIDKTTVYRCTEALVEKGLLIRKPKVRGTTYVINNPTILNELMENEKFNLETKSKQLEQFVETLIAEANNDNNLETHITVEKGVNAHLNVMKKQLLVKEKLIRQKINTNASLYDYSEYPEYGEYLKFMNKFIENRVHKKIFLKQIVHANVDKNLLSVQKSSSKLLKEVRILPTDIMKDISFKIFDDYFVITVHSDNVENIKIITIKDKIVAELMKSLFDYIFDRGIVYYGRNLLAQIKFPNYKSVSKLGIGSSGIGGFWYGKNPFFDDQNDITQVQHALSKGANYIDCCLMYGEGHTVEVLSKAIENYPRNDLFITCKLTKVNMVPVKNVKDIEKQCDRYLKELNIAYIDLFEIHGRSSLEIPKVDAVGEIERLIDKGKVKLWGVSNYSIDDLKEVMACAKYPLSANEIPFSLAHRAFEKDGTMEFCKKNKIINIAYFITGRGLLNQFIDDPNDNLLKQLALKYEKTIHQIAINWVLSKPNVLGIIKSTNGTHVNENYGALGWSMENEDYLALDKLDVSNPWLEGYLKSS